VKLINTDGMALVGPGSEWFWTALTGLILAVTFFAIYRQLSITRSATAFEQLTLFETELRSERMTRLGLDVALALREGVDPAHLPRSSAGVIAAYWERVGGLVRRGHLDAKLLWDGSGGTCLTWWIVLEPMIQRLRAESGPAFGENFEWLAGVMEEFDRRRGSKSEDWASIMANLDTYIADSRASLRLEEALRSAPPATAGPLPTVAPSVATGELGTEAHATVG
jgi:hypothetical protein